MIEASPTVKNHLLDASFPSPLCQSMPHQFGLFNFGFSIDLSLYGFVQSRGGYQCVPRLVIYYLGVYMAQGTKNTKARALLSSLKCAAHPAVTPYTCLTFI
jgi:hypothetical protein